MTARKLEPEVDPAYADALNAMFELHRDIGRRALSKAMAALDQADPADIPVNVAVQLLKLGADLERRALLGIEPDDEDDPFRDLARTLGGKSVG